MTSAGTGHRPPRRHAPWDGPEHVDVAIIGAGIAGLGLGLRLARTTRSFAILERGRAVGGTWRDNRYPGVGCDIPAHLYSYSFLPKHDWSRRYATGAEIQRYLVDCAATDGVGDRIHLDTAVEGAQWDAVARRWVVRTSRGVITADVLVAAAGRLSEPRLPDVDGLESFPGPVLHTSAWPDDLDLTGRRVGVVGSGASAVQLLPHVARRAERTVLFQRSAAWIVPRDDRAYGPAQVAALRDDRVRARVRALEFAAAESGHAARVGDAAALEALRGTALDHLAAHVEDAGLRAALTPDYEIGCKRIARSDDFHATFAEGLATLEPSALARVRGSTAIAASGAEHGLDVLVLATGFRAAEAPFAAMIRGRDGRLLSDRWSEGMTSFASTSVHGFPNLFILDGPHASLGHNSAVAMIEAQIDHVLRLLASLQPGDAVEPTAAAEAAFTHDVDDRASSTVWMTGGCDSWYRDRRSGRLTLLWPGTATEFRSTLEALGLDGLAWSRDGRVLGARSPS